MFLKQIPAFVCALMISTSAIVYAASTDSNGSTTRPNAQKIFDGKTLKGWKEVGGGKWSVKDGEIIGEKGDGRYGWLVFEKPVADFVLELECKHEAPGNSGIQFRSHVIENEMYGYQAEFDPRPDHGTGGIYEQGGRAWLKKPDAKGLAAMKPNEWNAYRIQCTGDRIQTWLNDTETIDIHDPQARSGIIALQVHSGEGAVKVRWRNIRLQDLGDGGGWTPIYDGKSTAGWHTQGEATCWRVEKGELIGELTKPSPYAYLATDKKYADFEFKCDMLFESNDGNSGIFFRCTFPPHCKKCDTVARDQDEDTTTFKCGKCGSTETLPMKDRVHIHGPQAEFAPLGVPTAAIYDARGKGWINSDKMTDRMLKMHRFHEWNDFRLIAVGDHILTYLNGYLCTNLMDYDFPDKGVIALQLHSGGAMKVRFKNIQIRPATKAPTSQISER